MPAKMASGRSTGMATVSMQRKAQMTRRAEHYGDTTETNTIVCVRSDSTRRGGSRGLLPPGRKGLGEPPLARRALLECQDGAAVVVIDDRDVEPGALLEQV